MKPFYSKLLFALFLMVLVVRGSASDNPGIITGKVIEHNTDYPVAFAHIALCEVGSQSVFKGITTDENGFFTLSSVPFNTYKLEVSYLGYQKTTLLVQIDQKHNPLNVGVVPLNAKSEKLDEVTITEERLKGTQEIDRTVYTINDKIQSVSQDGLDVLKHIPGVSVDFQENVTVEGSGNILYLVDGIARDKDFVAQLNPDNINKIEVISNPGVEYDADVSAVINIILKKRSTGGSGGFTITGGDPNKFTGKQTANIEYGNEHIRLFGSNWLHYQQYKAYTEKSIHDETGSVPHEVMQIGSGMAQWLRNNSSYGIDYFINEKNTLNLYGNYYHVSNRRNDFSLHSLEYQNQLPVNEFELLENSIRKGQGAYNSLFFRHDFDQSHQLTSQANYYYYTSTTNNKFEYDHMLLDANPTTLSSMRKESGDNIRNMIEWKNDYVRPIGNTKLKIGYWSYYQYIDNNFSVGATPATQFIFDEFRQEAYASLAGALGDFQYSGGLRTVFSKSTIDEVATNQYTEILPQVNLMYTIKKGQSVKLNGGRRIVRPNMNQLSPFQSQPDSLTINKGNPNLDPEIINRAELEYALNINSNYLAPKLFYEYSDNVIQQKSIRADNGTLITQPENIGKVLEYGLLFSASVNITKWLKVNGTTGIYNIVLTDSDEHKQEKVSGLLNTSTIISPWKERKINFSAIVQYQGPRLRYKSEITRDWLFLLAMDAALGDNFKISMYGNPMAQKYKYHASTYKDKDYRVYNEARVDVSYLFMAGITYKFNWGAKPKKLQRSTDYDSDGGGGLM
ncbi:MAG: TonB-dependent receptor [Salinivirgaceae bacterium]